MLKPKYDIGEKVAVVSRDHGTIIINTGTITSVEIRENSVKYAFDTSPIATCYVNENNLCAIDKVTSKVAYLLADI